MHKDSKKYYRQRLPGKLLAEENKIQSEFHEHEPALTWSFAALREVADKTSSLAVVT